MDKYCRICWNTKKWKQPTGEAEKLETGKSYVAENGFGHEEWLFNFSWLLTGGHFAGNTPYLYGFLQPIGKYYSKYKGKIFSALLYTSPDGKCLFVASTSVPFHSKFTGTGSNLKPFLYHQSETTCLHTNCFDISYTV